MTHIAIQEALDGKVVEWMEKVSDELWPGKTEEQKTRLADEITRDVMNVLHYREGSVSVAVEEVKPEDWAGKVYQAGILSSPEKLYKKPEYTT